MVGVDTYLLVPETFTKQLLGDLVVARREVEAGDRLFCSTGEMLSQVL